MKNNCVQINSGTIASTGIQTQKINFAEIMSPITSTSLVNKKKKGINQKVISKVDSLRNTGYNSGSVDGNQR